MRKDCEARSLSLDPLGRWIVDHAEGSTDYLTEIEEMIACWDEHRSGNLEGFAARLAGMGKNLTYKTFSETKLSFLRDNLAEISDAAERVGLRISIASVLRDLARWREAEEQLRVAKDELPPDSPQETTVLSNLAQVLYNTNRFEEAEPLLRRALDIDRAAFGDEHPKVAIHLNNLATLLHDTKRLEEAEPLMREALRVSHGVAGATGHRHPNYEPVRANYEGLLRARGLSEDEIAEKMAPFPPPGPAEE